WGCSRCEGPGLSKAEFMEKVRRSNEACQRGDFQTAVKLYGEALRADPQNCILYSNRSAAHLKLGQYQTALDDAVKARLLNPKWPKAYFRQGVALQYLGRHADALAAFASGLAQDPKSLQLLVGMVEAAMKSPLRGAYATEQKTRVDSLPFSENQITPIDLITDKLCTLMLIAALNAGKGQVFPSGAAAAAENSGNGALIRRWAAASSALSSLGHVYTAIGDYPNALASHKQCVLLAKQSKDQLAEARELGNMGAVYIAMGDFDNAVQCHEQHLGIAKALGDKREEARAYSNLGSAYHYRRNFDKAMSYHTHVLELAQELEEKPIEMRAYAGLGHAARCMQDLERAKQYHEQQLSIAEGLKDRAAEGRASSNLGIIHQMKGDYETALKLHKAHLSIAQELNDYAAQGRAYGNMGNAYNALGAFDQAVRYHRQELQISMEVNDRASQASTHGNLAVAYQALGAHDRALQHYQNHLNIARELRDIQSEARALGNLGNFHCSRGEFPQAVPYYEQYLRLSPDLQDMESEGKICHNLGYAHYCLGSFQEAVKYYEQDLALAKDLHDKLSQAKAYCNLGLAFKALGDYNKAEECQKYLLSLAQSLNNSQARFRALGNLGDIFLCKKDVPGAIKFYEQQLALAHQVKERKMEANAYAALGAAYRMLQKYDKALGYHTQELEVYQELGDSQGECQAHGHLAAVYMSLGKYSMAFKCYEEQLELGQRLKDPSVEAQVYGNMGITKMNMGVMEDAIGYFEQQLAMLQQLSGNEAVLDRGRAYGNLGDCYDSLGDYEEAIKYYDQYLSVAQSLNHMQDQEKAYRGLGNGHRAMGNLQQSLVCFEKRLVVAHELGECSGKAQAYGELGSLHSQLGNYEQAISCLERQLAIARDTSDPLLEGQASCGLGAVYQLMGEYDTALQFHQRDLQIAEEMSSSGCQGRAYGNLGLTYESLGNFERAVVYQEQHLSIAAETNDLAAKTQAYSSLGRTHHALQNYSQAVMYLQEGLRLAEQLGRREDEAKIRHRLGLSLWASGNLEEAQHQVHKHTHTHYTHTHTLYTHTHMSKLAEMALRLHRISQAGLMIGLTFITFYLYSLYSFLLNYFHEVYLGEGASEGGTSDFQESVGGSLQAVGGGGSSLEQHIANAREALGVDSYYIHFSYFIKTYKSKCMQFTKNNIIIVSLCRSNFSIFYNTKSRNICLGSVSLLQVHPRRAGPALCSGGSSMAAVVGNPRLPSSVMDRWLWGPMPTAEEEASMVAELLGCQPLAGPAATKERVMSALSQAECAHFATHISWKLAALVLTPSQDGAGKSSYTIPESLRMQDDASDAESICDSPPLQEFLLTAADILDLRLPVKLVVLGSYQESDSKVTADGVVGLTRAFLAAGAQCVLVSLWPVPVAASKMFVHAFYTALLNGTKASAALADAMKTVQSSKQFSHPSNWAGFMLIGSDVKLNSPSSLIGQALAEILQYPDKARDALRVLLHLVHQIYCTFSHYGLLIFMLLVSDSTELPKRLSLDSSSSLESLASAQSVSHQLPLGYPNPPFSPPCPDSLASDAISVYSLSSIASSMSFLSRPDGALDLTGQQLDRHRGLLAPQRHAAVPRSRSSPHSAAAGTGHDDEEYEGYSIISSEPLGTHCDTLPRPAGARHHRGATRGGVGRGYGASVSSRGSVSTPTSPVKASLIPSPNSPFQKVGKVSSSDTGESDQSSTETDSTVKSQEERPPGAPLDPQELAQKILEETQSHMRAVETLQRSARHAAASDGTRAGEASTPTGGSAFRSSETSAFSRPSSRASIKAQSSPLPSRPKPPSRTSSLQKISSGYNSPATSETSLKDGSQPSPTSDGHNQFKLKYPSSPYSGHISRSPSNISPSSGHQSPAGSAPSPALSYSSTGSTRSSPADAPTDLDRLRLAAIDEKVQAIHNLKTFWASATQQQHSGPMRAVRGGAKMSPAQRDVLGLLNLSPRHHGVGTGQDMTGHELQDMGLQSLERRNPPNGHRKIDPKRVAPSPTAPTGRSPGSHPIRLPTGNGYKFLSPGRFFPSSKC
uniref:Tetratricopeptide repeat protein 28 n=1 Tax=Astyanax mexicanus TaxID=7994 RepID=A0A8B9GZS1_ASTMX